MLLNSHVSAYTRSLAEKVCGLVRFTWGTSQGEDKLGARDKIRNTKVARRACAGQTFPLVPAMSRAQWDYLKGQNYRWMQPFVVVEEK